MSATVPPAVISVAGAAFVKPAQNGDGMRFYGSTSGYAGLKPGATITSYDLALPLNVGTVGQVLTTDGVGVMTWTTPSVTTPAGTGTELQYRNGAAFGAVTSSGVDGSKVGINKSSSIGAQLHVVQSVTTTPVLILEQMASSSVAALRINMATGVSGRALEVNLPGGSNGDGLSLTVAGRLNVAEYFSSNDRGCFGYYGASAMVGANTNFVADGTMFKNQQIQLTSGHSVDWTSGNHALSVDTGIRRNAAGVVEINNGTAGTYRDLKLRNLFAIQSVTTETPITVTGMTSSSVPLLKLNMGLTPSGNVFEINRPGLSGGDPLGIDVFGTLTMNSDGTDQTRGFKIIRSASNPTAYSLLTHSGGVAVIECRGGPASWGTFNVTITDGTTNRYPLYVTEMGVGIGGTSIGTNGISVLTHSSGTAPSTSPADCYQLYSADQAAGNACPHIRTENAAIIKLFQGAAVADAAGGVVIDAEARTALNALLARDRANGLIAT